jgi:hypothetical protein
MTIFSRTNVRRALIFISIASFILMIYFSLLVLDERNKKMVRHYTHSKEAKSSAPYFVISLIISLLSAFTAAFM